MVWGFAYACSAIAKEFEIQRKPSTANTADIARNIIPLVVDGGDLVIVDTTGSSSTNGGEVASVFSHGLAYRPSLELSKQTGRTILLRRTTAP